MKRRKYLVERKRKSINQKVEKIIKVDDRGKIFRDESKKHENNQIKVNFWLQLSLIPAE